MLSLTHPFFPTFAELIERVVQHEPIYDLGTSARFAKELKFVEHLFQGKEYFAGGYSPDKMQPNPCDFHSDVQDLNQIETGSVGSVISLEVLEHVQFPDRCINEAYRILKPGGVCLLSTPFITSYHGKTKFQADGPVTITNDHASYADYWRFTHEGLWLLFKQAGFSSIEIFPVDGPISARLSVLKIARLLEVLPFLGRWVRKIEQPRLGKLTTRHFVFAIK